MSILNRHSDFNKGVSKVLKMITMLTKTADEIVEFIMCRFPVGTLTAKNILSLVRFLSKIAISESPKAAVAGQILR